MLPTAYCSLPTAHRVHAPRALVVHAHEGLVRVRVRVRVGAGGRARARVRVRVRVRHAHERLAQHQLAAASR